MLPDDFEWKKANRLKLLHRRLAQSERRLVTLCSQLEEAQQWETVFHEAQLLQAHFHLLKKDLTAVTVADWLQQEAPRTLILSGHKKPEEEVAARFKKSKKLHKAIPHLETQIALKRQEQKRVIQQIEQCEAATHLEQLPLSLFAPPRRKRREGTQRRDPYQTFLTASGLKIMVGRKAHDNDRLSLRIAKGSDYWLHAHNFPGAHVVLQVPKGTLPDTESLEDALQVALHHSQAKGKGSAEILVTQQKYLSKTKGAPPGQVSVSKHRIYQVKEDQERYDTIRKRKSTLDFSPPDG